VDRGVLRIHPEGLAENLLALVVAALQPEQVGEVDVRGDEPGREAEGGVVVPPRLLEPSPLHVDDPQVDVGLRALGVRSLGQVEVVERAVEGRARFRRELLVGHVGERGHRLHAHRPHGVPQ
jgi:hypothetical protein